MIGAKIRSITKAHKPDRFRRVPDLGRGSSVISACLSESELDTQFQIVFFETYPGNECIYTQVVYIAMESCAHLQRLVRFEFQKLLKVQIDELIPKFRYCSRDFDYLKEQSSNRPAAEYQVS